MKTAHLRSRSSFFFPLSRENRLEISYLHSVSTEKNKNAHVPTTSHHARKPNSKRSPYTAKKKKREFTKRFKKKKGSALRWAKPYFQHLVCLQLRRKQPCFFSFIVVFCYDRSSPCFKQREERVKKKSSLWEVLSERGTSYHAFRLIPFFTPRFLLSLWMSWYKIWTNAAITKGKKKLRTSKNLVNEYIYK